MLGEEPWSPIEVRKLVGLIAAEHARAKNTFDALPVGIGILGSDLRVKWANEPLKNLTESLGAESFQQTVRRSLQSGGDIEVDSAAEARVKLRASRSVWLRDEIVVLSQKPEKDSPPAPLRLETLSLCHAPLFIYDSAGNVRFATEQAEKLTGRTAEMLRTGGMNMLFPDQHAVLTTPGECRLVLQDTSGANTPLRCKVKTFQTGSDEPGFCLTVIDPDPTATTRAINLATVEGCLAGAFPHSSLARTILADCERFSVRTGDKDPKRVLTVTEGALRSERFRDFVAQIPEAMNIVTDVVVTEKGVSVPP